ncbi:hypothetical protein R4Z09_19480 [Niallia oryzisoli]|uniref:Uncharacterized protein n=1 Tax=Niallia oryzisoli TaxID=1737571 RepID=A0ABZ2C7C8_9BACI
MVLFFISIFLFNLIALIKNKIPSIRNVSIWTFTIAFQVVFDVIVEFKYNGYWYFDKGIDWIGIVAHTVLIPPVNILLLSWFPFNSNLFKQAIYITCWTVGVIVYEALVLLPEPWGFFHLGWWKLWYDVFAIPILILILLGYYKVICKLEKKLLDNY